MPLPPLFKNREGAARVQHMWPMPVCQVKHAVTLWGVGGMCLCMYVCSGGYCHGEGGGWYCSLEGGGWVGSLSFEIATKTEQFMKASA